MNAAIANRPSDRFIIIILGILMTVTPFAIDLYLPVFPQIARAMGTSEAQVSLSVASYFVGMAFGQVFYGPCLDRFGRKKPLFIGLAIFIATSLGCLLCRNVETMIVLRFLQALGGCAAQVAALTMVRDFFPVEKSAKVLSLLMLILGVSPLLAPTLGGIIAVHFGWQWIFLTLAGIATFVGTMVFFFLPEPHKPDPSISLRPKPIVLGFAEIMREPSFFTYALAGTFSFAGLLVYVTGSPIIFMSEFHVSPQTYGLIFALLACGFLSSNQVNVQLLKKFHSGQIFQAALIYQCVVGMIFLVGVVNGWWDLYATIFFLFMLLGCLGMTYPNGAALALAPFEKNAGSASSLIGFLQIGVASIASAGIGIFDSAGAMPIFIILAVTPLMGLAVLLIGKKHIKHSVLDEAPLEQPFIH